MSVRNIFLALAVLFLNGVVDRILCAAEVPFVFHASPHFIIATPKSELDAGSTIKEQEQHLQEIAESLEQYYDVFIKRMGCLPPAGANRIEHNGTPKTLVLIYQWKLYKHERFAGLTEKEIDDKAGMAEDGAIHLPAALFGAGAAKKETPLEARRFRFRALAHELFHTIQEAYAPENLPGDLIEADRWLREATAAWSEKIVFREHFETDFIQERKYLRFPYFPIQFVDYRHLVGGTAHGQVSSGHAYGTSVMFHYLTKQHRGEKFINTLLEKNGELLPTEGTQLQAHPLRVVAKSLGYGDEQDSGFLQEMTRYAVSCALGMAAPETQRLPHAQLIGQVQPTETSTIRLKSLEQMLKERMEGKDGKGLIESKSGWIPHYENTSDPNQAGFRLPGSLPEHWDIIEHVPQGPTWIGSCGFRVYQVVQPAGLPGNAAMQFLVRADGAEVSVVGLVGYAGETEVRQIPAIFEETRSLHRLMIPRFNRARDPVNGGPLIRIVVVRHSDSPVYQSYPMSIIVADPPVLSSLRLSQQRKEIYRRSWSPIRNGAGILTGYSVDTPLTERLASDRGDVHIQLTFSNEVRPVSSLPVCAWNDQEVELTTNDKGRTWEGQVPVAWITKQDPVIRIRAEYPQPGSKLVLPLDTNPGTLAEWQLDHWTGYERSSEGMVFEWEKAMAPLEQRAAYVCVVGDPENFQGLPQELDPASKQFDMAAAPRHLTTYEPNRFYEVREPVDSTSNFGYARAIYQFSSASDASAELKSWVEQTQAESVTSETPACLPTTVYGANFGDPNDKSESLEVEEVRAQYGNWVFSSMVSYPDDGFPASYDYCDMALASTMRGAIRQQLVVPDVTGVWTTDLGQVVLKHSSERAVEGSLTLNNGEKASVKGEFRGLTLHLTLETAREQGAAALIMMPDDDAFFRGWLIDQNGQRTPWHWGPSPTQTP